MVWEQTWTNDDEFLPRMRHSCFFPELSLLDVENLRWQQLSSVTNALRRSMATNWPSARFFLECEEPNLWQATFTLDARLQHVQSNVKRWRMRDALPGLLTLLIHVKDTYARVWFFFESQVHRDKLIPTSEDCEVVRAPFAREPLLSVPVYHRAV